MRVLPISVARWTAIRPPLHVTFVLCLFDWNYPIKALTPLLFINKLDFFPGTISYV